MTILSSCFDLVWESSLRCSLLIGFWLLVCPMLRGRVPAAMIFAAWVVIGLRLLFPLAIPARWSPYNLAKGWVYSEGVPNDGGLSPGTIDPTGVLFSLRTSPLSAKAASSSRPRDLRVPSTTAWARSGDVVTKWILIGVWGVGALSLASLRVRSTLVFWREVKQLRQPVDERVLGLIHATFAELKIKGRFEVWMSPAVPAPAVSGWWRPTLLFPAKFASSLSDADLRWVILHELGHWKRRDCWAHALLEWGRILHWFNPLVWLCAKVARLDCELACDEYVMARAGLQEPADYGAALLKILGVVRSPARTASAVGIFENKQQLKRRIHMIAKYRSSTFGRVLSGGVILAALGLISATRETYAQPSRDLPIPASVSSANGVPAPNLAAITQTVPNGWFVNGSHPRSYIVGLDATEVKVAPISSYIKSIESDIPGFGGMMQSFDAKEYHGKRVRFSAWIKTAKVSKSANIWMRVDGTKGILRFDNIDNRAPNGTRDWQHYAAVLDVPEEAEGIYIGFFVSGTGQAWFNDAKFDVVDSSIQETNMPIHRSRPKPIPVAPQNLSFEAGIPQ